MSRALTIILLLAASLPTAAQAKQVNLVPLRLVPAGDISCPHSAAGLVQLSVDLDTYVYAADQVRIEPTRPLITQTVDNNKRVTLVGNTPPEANAANDRGPVPDSLPMQHMRLLLRLPSERQAELNRFLQGVQEPKSPNYHKWLTPQQFKEEFTLAPEDIHTISRWLKSEGFKINATNATSIDFSGTAGQVQHAFRTPTHDLDVKGVRHIANMSDPQIPAALAPAVEGILSLNDFRPHPLSGARQSQE